MNSLKIVSMSFAICAATLLVIGCGAPVEDEFGTAEQEATSDKYQMTTLNVIGPHAAGEVMHIWKGKALDKYDLPRGHRKVYIGVKANPIAISSAGNHYIDTQTKVVINQSYAYQMMNNEKRGVALLAENGDLYLADVDKKARAYIDTRWAPHTNVNNKVNVKFTVKKESCVERRFTLDGIYVYPGLKRGWPLSDPNVTGETNQLPGNYPVLAVVKLKGKENGKDYTARWNAHFAPGLFQLATYDATYEFVLACEYDFSRYSVKVKRINIR